MARLVGIAQLHVHLGHQAAAVVAIAGIATNGGFALTDHLGLILFLQGDKDLFQLQLALQGSLQALA